MAQAKRIKAKTKASKKVAVQRHFPWGLIAVIVVTGTVLVTLFNGAKNGDSRFGSGLNALLKQSQTNQDEDTQAIQELVDRSTEKEFDFYEVLPDIETVMPDDLPGTEPEPSRQSMDYYVQVASFRKNADAEKLRARLALKGFTSSTHMRTSEERGTYYRVRLGPYPDKRKAKTIKNKLKKIGVDPIVTSVKK